MPIGLHIQQGFVEIDVDDFIDVKAAADVGGVAALGCWSSHAGYLSCQKSSSIQPAVTASTANTANNKAPAQGRGFEVT